MSRPTGELTAMANFLGDGLSERRARSAMPILVRQAKANQPLSYQDLADEMRMPNPRTLNHVLGIIGNALLGLGQDWRCEVPPLQALVINGKTGLPGDGISWFAPDATQYESLSRKDKRDVVGVMTAKIRAFGRWDEVLAHFGLEPSRLAPGLPPRGAMSGGESERHRRFKQFVAKNPSVIGMPARTPHGTTEHALRSCDAIDVLFKYRENQTGVEVKTSISHFSDIERGLYQCVKYRTLLQAEANVDQSGLECDALLVCEGEFPEHLIGIRNTLGVSVRDKIRMPEGHL